MKRLVFITGFLLTLLPQAAAAADSKVCQAIKGITPISEHYVQKVLDRADEGMKHLQSASANQGFEQYLPSWARRIQQAANNLIDSYLTLSIAQDDLLDVTACLHVDELLLDCKMDEVQKELQSQLKKNSMWGIVQAEALLEFLRERKVHLVRGALNPGYEDPTWEVRWRFESQSSSAQASSSSSKGMCPFDSDYAAPGSDGYGCDDTVLGTISAYEPANAEKEALTSLKGEIDRYKQLAGTFKSLEDELKGLTGSPSTPSSLSRNEPPQGHRNLNGCLEQTPPDSLRLRSVRSPFSYKKNDVSILSDFLAKRAAEGIFREKSDDLKNPEEFKDEERRKKEEKRTNPLTQLFRNAARQFVENVSGLQGKQESTLFAVTPDATLEIAEALGDLRQSVGELSRLSGPKDGVRSFVIKFAYFLRRSCIYRPCNTSLERVLRTAYADECFPYTDGTFLGDSEGDPRWKKCARAACIQAEGVSLPSDCSEVLP